MYWTLTLWTMSAVVFLVLPVTMITTGPFRMRRRFLLNLLLHTLFMTTIQAKLENTLLSIALNIWLGVILNVVLTTALHNIPQRIRAYVVPYVVLAIVANLTLYTILKLASNTLLNIGLSSVCYPMLNLQILHLVLYSLDTQSTPSAIFYSLVTPLLRRLIVEYNLDLADGYFMDPYVLAAPSTVDASSINPLPRQITPTSPTDLSTPKFCTTTRTTYLCGHSLSSTVHTPSSLLCLTTRARSHCRTHTAVGCGCPSGRIPSSSSTISADELCKPIVNPPVQSPDPCPACNWRHAVPERERSDWVLSATGRLVPNAAKEEEERRRPGLPPRSSPRPVGSPSPSRPRYVSPPASPPRARSPPPTPLQRTRFT